MKRLFDSILLPAIGFFGLLALVLLALVATGNAQTGTASWYGPNFHGRRAADGSVYDMHKLTAAHKTLPFGTLLRVTNLRNGRSVVVRVTDRGPFIRGRILDVSYAAACRLGMVESGLARVRIEVVTEIAQKREP